MTVIIMSSEQIGAGPFQNTFAGLVNGELVVISITNNNNNDTVYKAL